MHPNQQFSAPQIQQPQMAQRPVGPSWDLTDRDLSSHMGQAVTAKGGLKITFFWNRVKTRSRNAKYHNQVQTRLCVAKQPLGDRKTVAVETLTEKAAQERYPQEFAMFKQYGEIATTGTPLSELPGISMSDMGLLAMNGLRSIEDLAGLTEDLAAQMGMQVTRAHKVAKTWFERKEKAAPILQVAEMEARYNLERETNEKRMAEQDATIAALQAQIAALAGSTGVKEPGEQAQPMHQDRQSDDDELPYDLSEMDNPMLEGPSRAEGVEELGSDPDPLEEVEKDIDPLDDGLGE